MTLTRTHPFAPLAGLFPEINRVAPLLDALLHEGTLAGSFGAPVRVDSTDNDVTVSVELPGVESKDLELSVESGVLHIRGTRATPDAEGTSVLRRERSTGAFAYAVDLPFEVESGKAVATLRNGILAVALPRAEADRPRRITIQN